MKYGRFEIGQVVYNSILEYGTLIDILTDEFMPKFKVRYQHDNIRLENYCDIKVLFNK